MMCKKSKIQRISKLKVKEENKYFTYIFALLERLLTGIVPRTHFDMATFRFGSHYKFVKFLLFYSIFTYIPFWNGYSISFLSTTGRRTQADVSVFVINHKSH